MRVKYNYLLPHLYRVRHLPATGGIADGDAKSAPIPTTGFLAPALRGRGGDVALVPQVLVSRGAASGGALALPVLIGGLLG